MSLHELADQLTRSFQLTAALLQQLLTGMTRRRTAWISARPSTLAEPVAALETLSQQIAAEEQRRTALIARIAPLLPVLPGVAAERRHVNASIVAAALPSGPALRLRQAAGNAASQARELRREIALGERLLQFSARAHDALLQGLTGAARADGPVYDRSARRAAAGGPGVGSLVDGRL
jgi:hypothetical protein